MKTTHYILGSPNDCISDGLLATDFGGYGLPLGAHRVVAGYRDSGDSGGRPDPDDTGSHHTDDSGGHDSASKETGSVKTGVSDTADSAALPTDTSDGKDTSGLDTSATTETGETDSAMVSDTGPIPDTGPVPVDSGRTDTALDTGAGDTATVDTGSVCTATTWYADADGDGFGDAGTTTSSCTAPTGYVSDSTDCDDADASYWYACTTCERTLVDSIGFSQNEVWPGDSSDVVAQISLDSTTSAVYVGVRWSVGMDDYVTCATADSSGAVPTATMDLQYAGSYLAFGWWDVAGAINYVSSADITGATVDSFSYLNYGDVGGNAYLAP